jgi:hypothetical protein
VLTSLAKELTSLASSQQQNFDAVQMMSVRAAYRAMRHRQLLLREFWMNVFDAA